MSVWKEFCRLVESKAVRRHFGDLVPQIETSAIFEFTDEQVVAAKAFEPETSEVQPFPFPRMCCVGPGGVIVMQSPVMDEETGVLTYDSIIAGQGVFLSASCTVNGGTVTASNVRGMTDGRYFDESTPLADKVRSVDEMLADSLEARALIILEKAEASGDAAMVRQAREMVTKGREADDDLRARRDKIEGMDIDIDRLEADLLETSLDVMRDNFALGLSEIQWINKPDHYTVEIGPSAPPRKRKKSKRARVTRLAERPRHIVLTKSEITEAWHRVNRGGTKASPMPHLRRGHYRTLRAARYGESRGKRVWVRASHVNGQCVEWRDGDVRYRVI